MAELLEEFDGTGVQLDNYDVIPTGNYTAMITATSDWKVAKKNPNNKYIEVEFTITQEGKYNGRRYWERLNMINDSPTAEDMAKKAMEGIRVALGIEKVKNTNVFVGRNLLLKLSCKPQKDTGELQNVAKFAPLDDVPLVSSAAKPAPVATAAAADAPATGVKKKPWEKAK